MLDFLRKLLFGNEIEELKQTIDNQKRQIKELEAKLEKLKSTTDTQTKELSKKQTKHLDKVHSEKYKKIHAQILQCTQGLYVDDYKKEDGSWNIYKISKDTKISRQTVRKHLENS